MTCMTCEHAEHAGPCPETVEMPNGEDTTMETPCPCTSQKCGLCEHNPACGNAEVRDANGQPTRYCVATDHFCYQLAIAPDEPEHETEETEQ